MKGAPRRALLSPLLFVVLCSCSTSAGTTSTAVAMSPSITQAVPATTTGAAALPACAQKAMGDPLRTDLIGMTLAAATAQEKAAGHTIRVLGTDGVCADATADYKGHRVNLVIEHGIVVWAMAF